jgi:hypothetical protein
MTQKVMTDDEEVSGSTKFFVVGNNLLLFSVLLEGVKQISGVLLLKM